MTLTRTPKARWQSGYATACKAVDTGSIPVLASKFLLHPVSGDPKIQLKRVVSMALLRLPMYVAVSNDIRVLGQQCGNYYGKSHRDPK